METLKTEGYVGTIHPSMDSLPKKESRFSKGGTINTQNYYPTLFYHFKKSFFNLSCTHNQIDDE